MTSFLKKPQAIRFRPLVDPLVVELVLLVELVQQVLRPLDRTGDELREEHHVGRVDDEVPLGRLPSRVDLDHVAEALECVERQADRQDDRRATGRSGVQPNTPASADEVVGEEVEVLEDEQHERRSRRC